ncbi:MAG: hypothetical protein R3C28_31850 [Pirellulaceae bacterium]
MHHSTSNILVVISLTVFLAGSQFGCSCNKQPEQRQQPEVQDESSEQRPQNEEETQPDAETMDEPDIDTANEESTTNESSSHATSSKNNQAESGEPSDAEGLTQAEAIAKAVDQMKQAGKFASSGQNQAAYQAALSFGNLFSPIPDNPRMQELSEKIMPYLEQYGESISARLQQPRKDDHH